MYRIKNYCNDVTSKYWEGGKDKYKTYDEAFIACFTSALQEVQSLMCLMEPGNVNAWFEVELNFEVTEAYKDELTKDVSFFPVAVVFYDHAPWDRDNDCDIRIVTGYDIIKIEEELF